MKLELRHNKDFGWSDVLGIGIFAMFIAGITGKAARCAWGQATIRLFLEDSTVFGILIMIKGLRNNVKIQGR